MARTEEKVKKRGFPIAIVIMAVVVFYFLIHWLVIAPNVEDNVAGEATSEQTHDH